MVDLIPKLRRTVPGVVQDLGETASERVIEFFTAEIRNPNTREAYTRAVRRFFRWAARKGLDLSDIGPLHVAAYVEEGVGPDELMEELLDRAGDEELQEGGRRRAQAK